MPTSEAEGTPIPIRRSSSINQSWTAVTESARPLPVDEPSPEQPMAPPMPPTAPLAPDALSSQPPVSPVPFPSGLFVQPPVPSLPAIPPPPFPLPASPVHHPARWLVGAGVSLVVLGVGILLWFLNLLPGLPRDPQQALAQSYQAFQTQTAYHVRGEITVTMSDGSSAVPTQAEEPVMRPFVERLIDSVQAAEDPAGTGCPGGRGSTRCGTTDPVLSDDSLEVQFVFEADRQETTSQSRVSVDLSRLAELGSFGVPPRFDIQVRAVRGMLYLRLPLLSLILGTQENKWLALSEDDLTTLAGERQLASLTDQEFLTEILQNTRRMGREEIHGQKTTHYQVELDPPSLARFLAIPDDPSLETTLRGMTAVIDWWAGNRDRLPYRIAVNLEAPAGESQLHLLATTDLSAYGESVVIAAPEPESVTYDDPLNFFSQTLQSGELLSGSQQEVNDARRKADVATMQAALELYHYDYGRYPVTSSLDSKTTDGAPVLQELVTKGYLMVLPEDPRHPDYFYGYHSQDGTDYALWCLLENEQDSDGENQSGYWVYRVTNHPTAGADASG
ncbi:type II secretion system protein GspG [Candidatus Berkelbacteria bacterium]|nr:type II secretion system protein GspG [Candidatus Berkelbacteria bacterium]